MHGQLRPPVRESGTAYSCEFYRECAAASAILGQPLTACCRGPRRRTVLTARVKRTLAVAVVDRCPGGSWCPRSCCRPRPATRWVKPPLWLPMLSAFLPATKTLLPLRAIGSTLPAFLSTTCDWATARRASARCAHCPLWRNRRGRPSAARRGPVRTSWSGSAGSRRRSAAPEDRPHLGCAPIGIYCRHVAGTMRTVRAGTSDAPRGR